MAEEGEQGKRALHYNDYVGIRNFAMITVPEKKKYLYIISDNIILHVKGKPLIRQYSYFQMNSSAETSEQLC